MFIKCWSFKFSRSSSFVENKRSNSEITPHDVFKKWCTLRQIEKDLVVLQFGRRFEVLTEEIPLHKSLDRKFLNEWASTKKEWNVFLIRNGKITLK